MANHQQRIKIAIDYIDEHLDHMITLEQLSSLCSFSNFHFQRVFKAQIGINPGKYIRLKRLKQAVHQLAFRLNMPIVEIAMATGFDNASSFTREFKKVMGITPSQFRAAPDWAHWQTQYALYMSKVIPNENDGSPYNSLAVSAVKIVDFPQTAIALTIHQGPPHELVYALQRFIVWRQSVGLRPPSSRTFNILYDDPESVPAQSFRFGLAASLSKSMPTNAQGVYTTEIPGGRCAYLRYSGSDDGLADHIHFLYGTWLSQSNETLRDYPCFIERCNLYPDVSEGQSIIDIYLPIV
ncbi:MAG: AraC family transcriptional regulator [Paraglaciecola sp.]|nr:AraC family transcriptional regulator [Paraglaciecola sp.]NCT48046.1 AraC family transcriptional regulator [Paraglaciecola sp.]